MEQEINNSGNPATPPPPKDTRKEKTNGSLVGGIILITLGVLFLIDRFFPRVDFGDLWPVILVVGGVIMVFNAYRKKN